MQCSGWESSDWMAITTATWHSRKRLRSVRKSIGHWRDENERFVFYRSRVSIEKQNNEIRLRVRNLTTEDQGKWNRTEHEGNLIGDEKEPGNVLVWMLRVDKFVNPFNWISKVNRLIWSEEKNRSHCHWSRCSSDHLHRRFDSIRSSGWTSCDQMSSSSKSCSRSFLV